MKKLFFTLFTMILVAITLCAQESPYGFYPDDFIITDSVPNAHRNSCLECFDKTLCIVAMEDGSSQYSYNYFKISVNGGITWDSLKLKDKIETKLQIYDIEFIDSGEFLACGTDGYIIRVYNNLTNVEIIRIEEIEHKLKKIEISKNGFGMCRGDGKLFYTEDYGRTWHKSDINPEDYGMESIYDFEITENYIYVEINEHEFIQGIPYSTRKLLRTGRENIDWTVIDLPEYAQDLDFVNDSTGWACGDTRTEMVGVYGKAVYKLTNYGENIENVLDATYIDTFSPSIRGVDFKDENEGLFYGGGIMYTSDGGATWIKIYKTTAGWPPNSYVFGLETFPGYKMIFLEKNYLFANLNATTVEIEKENSTLSLHPNPATDHIIIEADILSGKLEIYNILGIKVAEQAIASGREKIDVSSLPAGMYFLKAGDQVRKFVKR